MKKIKNFKKAIVFIKNEKIDFIKYEYPKFKTDRIIKEIEISPSFESKKEVISIINKLKEYEEFKNGVFKVDMDSTLKYSLVYVEK